MEDNGVKLCDRCFSELIKGKCACADQEKIIHPLALRSGTVLQGRYVIGRLLGSGGFAITYLAWDQELHKKIAIKEYFPNGIAWRGHDRLNVAAYENNVALFIAGAKSFNKEATRLTQLNDDPHIVKVFASFQENGTAYYTMEYLLGQNLGDYVQKQPGGCLPLAEAQAILTQVMQALQLVHDKGIIHRDIKPANIFICAAGVVKLLDFGTAKQLFAAESYVTECLITKGYAPWEQYVKNGRQGTWSDTYALGATMYYMLRGIAPAEAMEALHQDLDVTGLTPAIAAWLQKALQYDIEQRWQTVAEMREALAAIKDCPDNSTNKPGPVPGRKHARQGSSKKYIMAGILLAALALGVFIYYSSAGSKAEPAADGTVVDSRAGTNAGQTAEMGGAKSSADIQAEVLETGSCGSQATWSYYSSGDLVISGTGAIFDYDTANQDEETAFASDSENNNSPLAGYKEKIVNLIIENGITHVGANLFNSCYDLKTVTLPVSVTSIGNGAFYACEKLQQVFSEARLESVGEQAFADCVNLREINLSAGLKEIGASAFARCTVLQTANLPAGLESIGQYAFYMCHGLQMQELPASLLSIGKFAFVGCNGLTELIVPPSITKINPETFRGCQNLKKVAFAGAVTTIEDWAFNACRSLQEVAFPDTITHIGAMAFGGCPLTGLELPAALQTIGYYAFGAANVRELVIPEGVTEIGDKAFANCFELTTLLLPESVARVGDAFNDCINLREVTVLAKELELFPLKGSRLERLYLSRGVTSIDIALLTGANLQAVYYEGTPEEWAQIKFIEGDEYDSAIIGADDPDFAASVLQDGNGQAELLFNCTPASMDN